MGSLRAAVLPLSKAKAADSHEEVALILPRCCARGVAVDAREGGHLLRLGGEAVEVLLVEGEVSRAVVEGEGVAYPFIAVGLGDA